MQHTTIYLQKHVTTFGLKWIIHVAYYKKVNFYPLPNESSLNPTHLTTIHNLLQRDIKKAIIISHVQKGYIFFTTYFGVLIFQLFGVGAAIFR